MGNTTSIGDPKNCGNENGVLVIDNDIPTCYISSTIVNISKLGAVTTSKNTSVQAFDQPNGFGNEIPLTYGKMEASRIKSLKITVNLSGGAIAAIVIGSIILTFMLSYGGYHGYKHYRRRWRGSRPMMSESSLDFSPSETSDYMNDVPMGGYQKFRY